MTEKDIWRAADLIVENHGDQAECVACDRIEEMIARDDPVGERVWKQILLAVKQLQRSCPGSRERLH